MASVGREKGTGGTRYYVQLSPGEDEGRSKIRLGRVTRKQAETAKGHIASLIACRMTGDTISPVTQQWLADLPDGFRDRLERVGVASPRNQGGRYTVAEWVGKYIDGRPDVKAGTRRKWRDVESKLTMFFRDTLVGDVTRQAAKDFRVYLQSVSGLAENSIRRQIGIARQFFNAAIDARLITQNPFTGQGQPVAVRPNESRFHYVTPETAQKVLDACPDAEWRLIFALARFGGLRCPSEVLRLQWQDVDFEREQFTVHASKTEHHANGGIRTVPMFPELRPLFQDAFDAAKDGAVYCIERYRDPGVNLRTQLTKIIRRAGLDPWQKLFQNLRSTRETELFKLTGGNVKAVCTWLGNSPTVAMQHYAQTTEADLREAVRLSVLGDAKEAVQNPVHNPVQTQDADGREDPQETPYQTDENAVFCGEKRDFAEACETPQKGEKWAILDSNQ
ncbi:MAG: tyrosine-type recombinase/integrase [Acetivibrionales bacterium]|jgi:integrase